MSFLHESFLARPWDREDSSEADAAKSRRIAQTGCEIRSRLVSPGTNECGTNNRI
jgi:hypothetical protein